jgi:hypothetical protein
VIETGGVFVDLDGDGTSEIVVTHVTPPPYPLEGDTAPKVYRYEGGALVSAGAFAQPPFQGSSQFIPRAIVDLDGDGSLDVLTSRSIAWGKAGGGFGEPAFYTPGIDGRGAATALEVADVDDDGWLDVVIGGAACQEGVPPIFPLVRVAERTFAWDDALIEQPIYGRSYATMKARIEGETFVGTLFSTCYTDVDPPPFYRRSGDTFAAADLLPPSYPLTSPMGAALGDLDGDGALDLAITEHPAHAFFAGGSLPLADVSDQTGMEVLAAASLVPMISWGVAFLDLDRDRRQDVVTTHGNDFQAWFEAGYAVGPQWSTVHLGRGGFALEEVRAGLEREGQWKSLAVGDLEGDGDPDLIVGAGGEAPRVYRNDIEGGHGFALRLAGTSSNSLGLGAVVTVQADEGGASQVFLNGSVWSPDLWSAPLVFVGLGDATKAAKVTVRWPTGYVQELTNIEEGGVRLVVEPQLFAIEPSGRHLPADGVSVAKLYVTPRQPDGTPRAAAVTATVAGACALDGVADEGSSAVVSVTAPAAPGSCVVTLSIDGVPVEVRPRLFWD